VKGSWLHEPDRAISAISATPENANASEIAESTLAIAPEEKNKPPFADPFFEE
jgi:hypothetical protein